MSFGLQNQRIAKTPTGRIDSAYLTGADGSDVTPSWNTALPNLTAVVGSPISIDLIGTGLLTDPGSPSSEIGFYPVSGQNPAAAGFSITSGVLSNSVAFASFGTFQFVAIRNGISVLSGQVTFTFSAPAGTDNIAPTIPTSIAVAPGTIVGTIALTCDAPSDLAPGGLAASGSSHIDVLVNGAVASPPSPVVTPANALQTPTNVNIGSISSPDLPSFSQSGKAWTLSAAGTGIAATTSEQCGFMQFGAYSGAQKFVSLLDPYTSTAGTALVGIMVHETGVAGGKFIAIGLRPSNGTVGLYVITRATAGASSTQVATAITDSNGQSIVGPVYVMIERAADNKTWTVSYSLTQSGKKVITTQTLAMNASVQYGGFATSQSAGTDVLATIEEVSITNNAGIAATISASSPVSIQLRSVDQGGNISGLSASILGVPKVQQNTGPIVWKPGIRIRLGGYSGASAFNSTVQSQMATIFSQDINNQILGICLSPTLAQLEGAQGDYTKGINLVQPYITYLKSLSPPRDVTILINGGGNGWSTNSGGMNSPNFLTTFCPSYMNNATYSGGEIHYANGAPLDRPYLRIDNASVCARIAACVTGLYNALGPDTPTGGIYRYDMYQEISINVKAGVSQSAIANNAPAWFSAARAGAPKAIIFMKPTYAFVDGSSLFGTFMNAMFANKISMGAEDTANGRIDYATKMYLGQYPSIQPNHTIANNGNPDWDFHCNVDDAELEGNTPQAAVPPAHYGSGLWYDKNASGHPGIMTFVNQVKGSHLDVYYDTSGGPNVNRRPGNTSTTTNGFATPNNPTPGPGAGTNATRPNMVDVHTGNTFYAGIEANSGPGFGCSMAMTAYPY